MSKYDWERICSGRHIGHSWAEIINKLKLDVSPKTLRTSYSRWCKKHPILIDSDPTEWKAPEDRQSSITVELPHVNLKQVHSLDDLIRVLEVDRETWRVSNFKGNAWEQHSVEKGMVTMLQVKADFERDIQLEIDAIRAEIQQLLEDAGSHAPDYGPIERKGMLADNPVCAIINVYDPHLGMLAWGEETGQDFDLKIAVSDYGAAVEHLLSLAGLYPVEQIVYIVGHDFLHVDSPGDNQSGGVTARGTAQDVDTRLNKMFTAGRRALVEGIDRARRLGVAVRVEVVPGNHDRSQMYRMGEVLSAWYRKCDDVEVVYSPAKRSFYGWGKNAWMFTHGEEYKRTARGSLPLIFATESPGQLWVDSTYREILTGHNHALKAGRYHPTSDAEEDRAIRTFSLPGLTASDAWHVEQGYKHHRAATLRCYHESGGVAGVHEFTP